MNRILPAVGLLLMAFTAHLRLVKALRPISFQGRVGEGGGLLAPICGSRLTREVLGRTSLAGWVTRRVEAGQQGSNELHGGRP